MKTKIILLFFSLCLFAAIFTVLKYSFFDRKEELFDSRKISLNSQCTALGNSQEIHLIVIWSLARYKQEEILNDLKTADLEILDIFDLSWPKDKIYKNFNDMYHIRNLGPQKEKDSGGGPFLVVVLLDKSPKYQIDRYGECNNEKLFHLKHKYRKLTNVKWGIHGTSSPAETNENLIFLLGIPYETYLNEKNSWDGKIRNLGEFDIR